MSNTPDSPAPAEFTITHGDDEFTFRTPTAREIGALSLRAMAHRARDGGGSEDVLDNFGAALYRAAAIMELFLVKATVEWPFTPGPDGKPHVDSEAFPTSATPALLAIEQGFYQKLIPLMGA